MDPTGCKGNSKHKTKGISIFFVGWAKDLLA
jgi:hypothetical protein